MQLSGCLIFKDNKVLLLFRNDHKHYETPGGKVEVENPDMHDLKDAARRELKEELGVDAVKMKYFGNIEFTLPDGREGIAHKFVTEISGEPEVKEEIFSRFEYLPVENLEEYPISPDLRLLLSKIKSHLVK